MLYAHVVIMLYAHIVSSYYCTLGLYACASVNPINSRDRPRRSPCVDYTTTMKLFSSYFRLLYCVTAAGFAQGP